jgi:hypothetical protein
VLMESVQANHVCGEPLFIDPGEITMSVVDEGAIYFVLRATSYVLVMNGCPHIWTSTDQMVDQLRQAEGHGWLIASERHTRTLTSRLQLEPVTMAAPWMFSRAVPIVLSRVRQHD